MNYLKEKLSGFILNERFRCYVLAFENESSADRAN